MNVLRRYETTIDGQVFIITEYTKDGSTVSHTTREIKSEYAPPEQIAPTVSTEEMQVQILLNTEYLVIMSELNTI